MTKKGETYSLPRHSEGKETWQRHSLSHIAKTSQPSLGYAIS
uniref:Uncharacterized protein n=1 Tax=Anguilla anguilla TaxID=7936 RepID=A0A0E9WBX1_ANGAN